MYTGRGLSNGYLKPRRLVVERRMRKRECVEPDALELVFRVARVACGDVDAYAGEAVLVFGILWVETVDTSGYPAPARVDDVSTPDPELRLQSQDAKSQTCDDPDESLGSMRGNREGSASRAGRLNGSRRGDRSSCGRNLRGRAARGSSPGCRGSSNLSTACGLGNNDGGVRTCRVRRGFCSSSDSRCGSRDYGNATVAIRIRGRNSQNVAESR